MQRLSTNTHPSEPRSPSQDDLISLENALRRRVFKTNRQIIVGRAIAAYESSAEELFSFEATPLSLLGKTGVYQLTTFPITRFNGVPLPPGARIRFADRTRLFKGVMPKRLFEILSGDGKGYYAWDAHVLLERRLTIFTM